MTLTCLGLENLIKDLDAREITLNARVTALEVENGTLQKKLVEARANSGAVTLQAKSTWADALFKTSSKPSSQITNIISATKIELRSQEDRAFNLILFGLPLSTCSEEKDRETDDLSTADEILDQVEALGLSDPSPIKSVHRFKSTNGNKSPPLLVKLKCSADRRLILKHAKNLKNNSDYEKVFLAPDLSLLDREYRKCLLKEKDDKNNSRSEQDKESFRYGIRGNQVVKFKL